MALIKVYKDKDTVMEDTVALRVVELDCFWGGFGFTMNFYSEEVQILIKAYRKFGGFCYSSH